MKSIPLNVFFELTYNCNLKCTHCYVMKDRIRKELTSEEVYAILDQLAEAGCIHLTFTGGEIFLRRDFFDIAGYARKKGFTLRLLTNGTLVTSHLADQVMELRPLSAEISLYGAKKETYEKITALSGSFDRVIRGIRLLVERKIAVVIKTVVTRENINEVFDIERMSKDLGATFHRSSPLIYARNDHSRIPLSYRLSDSQLEKFMAEDFSRGLFSGWDPALERSLRKDNIICDFGRTIAAITPYGDLNPCIRLHLGRYNLKKDSFARVWKDAEEFQRIRSLKWSDLPACKDCDFFLFCFRCPCEAFLEEGNMKSPLAESCRQARIRKKVYERIKLDILKKEKEAQQNEKQ